MIREISGLSGVLGLIVGVKVDTLDFALIIDCSTLTQLTLLKYKQSVLTFKNIFTTIEFIFILYNNTLLFKLWIF